MKPGAVQVKAYRDTWELQLHSYLTYLRDRLFMAHDLLSLSGSIFVQIGEENVHHVRELLDEVFTPENLVAHIVFTTTTSERTTTIAGVSDHLLWYARDTRTLKFRPLFTEKVLGGEGGTKYNLVEFPDGSTVPRSGVGPVLPKGARPFRLDTVTSQRPGGRYDVVFGSKTFRPEPGYWKPSEQGFKRLIDSGRIRLEGRRLAYVRYFADFPVYRITNVWDDLSGIQSRTDGKVYAVQSPTKLIERCVLMTTDPGDLVLDPTCGSGTTAYVAEQWGRRWITIDTSRVPLALARQRLLTATFPYYELQDQARGPGAGFVYKRRQNAKGDEVGGIVPHVTLSSIANNEPPPEEVLVDRPEVDSKVTRVSGPFVVEATIPTPVDIDGDGTEDSGVPDDASYVDRMIEALRLNATLQLGGNRKLTLGGVRPPAQSLVLTAEASLEPGDAPVAIVFGPENGAVSEKLVYEAAREANLRSYQQLLVIGFAIEPNARILVDEIEARVGIPATYVQATPDLVMGDLLKTMRSSQLFSVAGLPDVVIRKVEPEEKGVRQRYEVELLGLDTFDPTTFEARHERGDDVPAWLLDTAWNGLSFHVSQAFFPRTSAWDGLRRALGGEFEESVWDHLAGTVSAPFTQDGSGEVAVKVIDDRGNELLVVKSLDEAQ